MTTTATMDIEEYRINVTAKEQLEKVLKAVGHPRANQGDIIGRMKYDCSSAIHEICRMRSIVEDCGMARTFEQPNPFA